jgi:ferredoxin
MLKKITRSMEEVPSHISKVLEPLKRSHSAQRVIAKDRIPMLLEHGYLIQKTRSPGLKAPTSSFWWCVYIFAVQATAFFHKNMTGREYACCRSCGACINVSETGNLAKHFESTHSDFYYLREHMFPYEAPIINTNSNTGPKQMKLNFQSNQSDRDEQEVTEYLIRWCARYRRPFLLLQDPAIIYLAQKAFKGRNQLKKSAIYNRTIKLGEKVRRKQKEKFRGLASNGV